VSLPAPALRPLPGHLYHCSISLRVVLRRSVSASVRPLQVIVAQVEQRKGGAEAQCRCQRPPSVLQDVIPFKIQLNQGCRQEARYGLRQADGSCPPQAAVTLHHAFKPFNFCTRPWPSENLSSSLAWTTASVFSTAVRIVFDVAHRNRPARGQHLVVDLGSC
jgi:hypothetical protein